LQYHHQVLIYINVVPNTRLITTLRSNSEELGLS
jgi:hypothetical protein